MKKILTLAILALLSGKLNAQSISLQPYLQNADSTSITISWETNGSTDSKALWGTSMQTNNVSMGSSITGNSQFKIHSVQLTDLEPDQRYFYRVCSNGDTSSLRSFRTPPLASQDKHFTLVAMSDMQIDRGKPEKFTEIVEDGILTYFNADQKPIEDTLGLVLVPGDLVDVGLIYKEWQTDFFEPGENLFSHVPVYPILGNHEANTVFYYRFFELPDNGSATNKEQWYYKDYSNVRIIGMDSNFPFTTQAQLNWLQNLLDETCNVEEIDFVFVQLHHPFHSELWPPGEEPFTGKVIEKLEAFSTSCGKPSIHFFGHTHGYSRGQSQDHNHLMVNVASAGGNIDYWGEYNQIDYEEYLLSQDEYGFVVVDVEAGASPSFTLKRISQGNDNLVRNNEERDRIHVYMDNQSPMQPSGISPNSSSSPNIECIELMADEYFDPDGDLHGASQWQVAKNCGGVEEVIFDGWLNHQNWYNNEDRMAGIPLTQILPENLEPFTDYCWRVRYRDRSLAWSEWSNDISFTTGDSEFSGNLLVNPGAEDGVNDWIVESGVFESLTSGECDGTFPKSGDRYFAVGGLCSHSANATVSQTVDVSEFQDIIESEKSIVKFGGYLSNDSGFDRPSIQLFYLNESGEEIGQSNKFTSTAKFWRLFDKQDLLPAETRSIKFEMKGMRIIGTDNDSYFDDLFLTVRKDTTGCDDIITNIAENNNTQNFTVFPNPIVDQATFRFNSPISLSSEIFIYNTLGKEVLREKVDHKEYLLLANKIGKGIFFFELRNKENTISKGSFTIQ